MLERDCYSFWVMTRQQLLLLLRYPVNMIAHFLLVLIMAIVVTVIVIIFSPLDSAANAGGSVLYGFVIYIFLSQTIWTIGMSVHKEKVAGTLTSIYLSAVSRFLNLLARAAAAILWTSIAAVIGLAAAQFITGPLTLHNPLLSLIILLFTISGLLGIGFAIAGLALWFGESVEIAANALEFGLMGICAFFYPFAILPPALLTVARLIPLSYSVDAFRTVALGLPRPELLPLNLELMIVLLSGVLGPPLGYAVFRYCEYQVRRRGLL